MFRLRAWIDQGRLGWSFIAEAAGFVWAERQAFARTATPTVVLLTLTYATLDLLVQAGIIPDFWDADEPKVLFWALWAFEWALYIAFCVAWHRRYLGGARTSGPRDALTFDQGDLVYLLYLALFAAALVAAVFLMIELQSWMLELYLVFQVTSWAPLVLGSAVYTASILLCYALALRFSLVLPAAAVRRFGFSLRASFRATRGALGAMAITTGLPVAVLYLGLVAFEAAMRAILPAAWLESLSGYSLYRLAYTAYLFALMAVAVSALSAAYRRLAPPPAAPSQS